MIATVEQIQGVQVRDFFRVDGKNLQCIAACVDCGEEREVAVGNLKNGNSKRCRSCASKLKTTHKMSRQPIYGVWCGVIQRCTNPNSPVFQDYGGRGIEVCKEWRDAPTFLQWAKKSGYESGLTLDRIDNGKGYSPENCRWTTRDVQTQNTRIRKDNTSGYRGVSRNKKGWQARINVDGTHHHISTHDKVEDAAHAYDDYVISHNLEHTLNFQRNLT